MKKIILTLGIAVASFATLQAQDQTQTQDKQEMIEGEGIEKIKNSEIPEEVNEGLKNSDFEGAEVAEAYILSGTALDQHLGDQALEMYIGDQFPDKVYQLQVSHDDNPAILYFTKEGELYASKDLEM
ncbi:hypothetical protein OKW21_003990 [Catalinimonas alkaloidigena]|uniref:hypothetical protein n=1 Tax=Catalinimonas alkaloidigena TaxID=1075417 RepID=UPI0024054B7D|nr:hypothetical protein [Catalinimonas alkaloidigena]MDF9798727.1 hypothetical protein [Catalinimonas alkaloidigena]